MRPSVIVLGDDWQQNNDEQEQTRERQVSICRQTPPRPKPEAHTGTDNKQPDEFENHSQISLRFGTRNRCSQQGEGPNYSQRSGTCGGPGPLRLAGISAQLYLHVKIYTVCASLQPFLRGLYG